MRAWRLDTLLRGSTTSLSSSRPILSSGASKSSWRWAPPRSVITLENTKSAIELARGCPVKGRARARRKPARAAPRRVPRPSAARARELGEAEARERLAALVGGSVRFEGRRDDGVVEGVRASSPEKSLRRLSGSGFEPQATHDLHGM